jgi:hypothetical protein
MIDIEGQKYDFKAYYSPLDLEKIKLRLREETSFRNAFRRDLTNQFMSTMRGIVNPLDKHEENTIWNVRGESGTSKSYSVISLAKQLTPQTFTYKNVVFFDQQILDIAETLPRDTFIIRDEAVKVYGVGSNRISMDMITLSETCRKYGINLAFLSPSDREIPIAKYILQTNGIDYKNRITRLALKDPSLNQFLGAVYVKVLPEDDYDWVMYNKAKDEFIKNVREGKKVAGKSDYKSMAIEVAEKIDIETFRSKKQRLAYMRTELSNLTNSEIDIIATFVEMVIKDGESSLDDLSSKQD